MSRTARAGGPPPVLELDLHLPRGGFVLHLVLAAPRWPVALAGPNGAGKTTLLRLLAGALRPPRGRIRVGATRLVDTDAGVWLPPEARRVGYLPQGHGLFPHLRVSGNVAYGLRHLPRPERDRRVEAALRRVGAWHLAERRPAGLSGGEAQRVALARALAPGPGLLLLDEPTAALDVRSRRAIRGLLGELFHEVPAVVVTHDPRDLAAWDPWIVVLEDGRLSRAGTRAELLPRAAADPFLAELLDAPGAPCGGSARTVPDGRAAGVRIGGSTGGITTPSRG